MKAVAPRRALRPAYAGAATAMGAGLKLKVTAAAIKELMPLASVLFVIWMIVNGQAGWSQLVLGAALALFVAGFSHYLLQERFSPNLRPMIILRLPLFGVLLMQEIVLANWDVLKRTFSRRLPISPRITSFDSLLSSDLARLTLANCITLTPGTVTLEVEGSRFHVHCLASEHEDALLEGRMERLVAWLFSEGPADLRRPR